MEHGLEGKQPLSSQLEANIAYICQTFADASDLVCRRLRVGQRQAVIFYLKGITDQRLLQEGVVAPLLRCQRSSSVSQIIGSLPASSYACLSDLNQAIGKVLDGAVLLICNGLTEAVAIDLVQFVKRSISEPKSEVSIYGPQVGFIENLEDNLALLRRKLRTPYLQSRLLRLGELTSTPVLICYLANKVQASVLAEVEQRLAQCGEG